MKNLPVEVSDEDIEEMWSFADKNGDGVLSADEYYEIFQTHGLTIGNYKYARKMTSSICNIVHYTGVSRSIV